MMAAILPPPGTLTPVVIQELEFASDLFRRAQAAIDQEFRVLRGAGVVIDFAANDVSMNLLRMAVECHLLALQARANRAPNVAQGVPA